MSPAFAVQLISGRSGLHFSLSPTAVLLLRQRLDFSEPLLSLPTPTCSMADLRPASVWPGGVDRTRILATSHSTSPFLCFPPLVSQGNRHGSGAGMVGNLLQGGEAWN